jgi:hypothetical protein
MKKKYLKITGFKLLAVTFLFLTFGCGQSSQNENPSSSSTNKIKVCKTCGETISGMGYFDDSETGWRPAKSNDGLGEITPICSQSCGMRYNRRNGDKPDNWSPIH